MPINPIPISIRLNLLALNSGIGDVGDSPIRKNRHIVLCRLFAVWLLTNARIFVVVVHTTPT
jgi:hypothetical protein